MTELLTDPLLDAIEAEMREGDQNDLSNGIHACIAELQACKRGLATLDHLFGRVVDDAALAETDWDRVEAEAAAAARREDDPKSITAAEIKGRMITHVNADPEAVEVRDHLRQAHRRKEKIERWMRSLEKRMSAAQTAQNGHEALSKYGGGG